MSIELRIKYTDEEYLNAVKEKFSLMPNKRFHMIFPAVFSLVLVGLLSYFGLLMTWWGIVLSLVTVIYAVFSLFSKWFTPRLALLLAKKKKLQDTYTFKIDQESIRRSSESGTVEIAWNTLRSIDFLEKNIFFNLRKGSVLIPIARLSESELRMLKSYAKNT